MEQRNWSEYRLVKESGLPPSTISNIFHRNTLPTIPTLEALCNTFGLTLSQFFADGPVVDLTPEQYDLLQIWAKLTEHQKKMIRDLMLELIRQQP